MAEWIPLEEAIKKGFVKEGAYIGYQPDKSQACLKPEETGCEEAFVYTHSKEYMGFRFSHVNTDGKILLVSADLTVLQYELRGKIGYEKGPEALKKACRKTFSNQALGADGCCMTEGVFNKIPETVKRISEYTAIYWLASPFAETIDGNEHFGMRFVFECDVKRFSLYSSDGKEYKDMKSLRPVVYLPPKTLIEVGNTSYDGKRQSQAFKIKPSKT